MNNCWFLVELRLQRYGNFGKLAYSDVTQGYSFVKITYFLCDYIKMKQAKWPSIGSDPS